MKTIRRTSGILEVGAGLQLASLIRYCSAHGLLDLTQCLGIPGTIGGAVTMNAGTRWGDMSSRVDWVECLDINQCKLIRLNREELDFGYRSSAIQGAALIVTSVGLKISVADKRHLQELMKERAHARTQVSIPVTGCAGSFFKNPQETSAGTLIDRCGLKGKRVGGAMVSPAHANYLVNTGEALSIHFEELIHIVRQRVVEEFGTILKLEVRLLGFHPEEAVQLAGRLA